MELRRGAIVTGEVVGPDGKPVREAWIFTRGILAPSHGPVRRWYGRGIHGTTRNGRFELTGLDPETDVPVYFLEPRRKLGIAIQLSGKSAASGPITVRLEPCGTAKARIRDSSGKPVLGPIVDRSFTMVMTPGPYYSATRGKTGVLAADEAGLTNVDPVNYASPLAPDSQGGLALPALIPGARYRCVDPTTAVRGQSGPAIRKEFTVKPANPRPWRYTHREARAMTSDNGAA